MVNSYSIDAEWALDFDMITSSYKEEGGDGRIIEEKEFEFEIDFGYDYIYVTAILENSNVKFEVETSGGYSDYDERMMERKAMGFSNF